MPILIIPHSFLAHDAVPLAWPASRPVHVEEHHKEDDDDGSTNDAPFTKVNSVRHVIRHIDRLTDPRWFSMNGVGRTSRLGHDASRQSPVCAQLFDSCRQVLLLV